MQPDSPAPDAASSRPAASHPARAGGDVNRGDRAFHALTTVFAVGLLVLLAAMALELLRTAAPSLSRFGFSFITGTEWDPVREQYGALPFIFGTVVSSLLALAVAVVVALGAAIWLSELAPPWLRAPVSFAVELLAAVPSVVYGLWGIFVLAPLLRNHVEPALARLPGPFFKGAPHGHDLLAGALILSIMILPTIASVSREVLRAIPSTLREGALALGATRWETIRSAVLPTARAGLFGAVILGLGRALGETMAVTMVIGNRAEISSSLFAPAHTMASVIANEFAEASSDLHLAALAEIGLLLFAVTVTLNVLARLLVRRMGGRAAAGA